MYQFARNLLPLAFIMFLLPQAQAQLISGMEAVQNAPLHAGVSRAFEHEYQQVLKLSREAILESGLIMELSSKIDDDTYMLIGKAKTSAFSWGELVRVLVSREGPRKTVVRVFSKRKLKVNITAKADYSQSILSNLDLKLNM